jgi:hypothetical protein
MLNNKEKKVLAIAYKEGVKLNEAKVVELWRTPHHRKAIFQNLVTMGLITPTESGLFIITNRGKEALGIEEDKKLMEFVK